MNGADKILSHAHEVVIDGKVVKSVSIQDENALVQELHVMAHLSGDGLPIRAAQMIRRLGKENMILRTERDTWKQEALVLARTYQSEPVSNTEGA